MRLAVAGVVVAASLLAALAAAAFLVRPPPPDPGACRGLPPVTPAGSPGPAGGVRGVPAGAQEAVVRRVLDGDSLCVDVVGPGGPLPAGPTHEVRVLEINAPGKRRCWEKEATAFARRELGQGARVYLVADRRAIDRYGRHLRYVWDADGELFNEKAVRLGHAKVLLKPPNDRYIARMRAGEAGAVRGRRGLWRACPLTRLLHRLRD